MTNETKHTPTPWRVSENAYGCFHIMHGEGRASSVVAGGNDHNTLSGSDAAHIVKCVNMHDELVGALKDISRITKGDIGLDSKASAVARLNHVIGLAYYTIKKAGAL